MDTPSPNSNGDSKVLLADVASGLRATGTKRFDPVLLILLAVSLSANVVLTLMLRHGIARPAAFAYSSKGAPRLPMVGARLEQLHLTRVDGTKVDLTFGASESVLVVYVLSPACGWCERNRAEIDSLASQLNGKYRIIGISNTSDGLASYVTQKSPHFPVYSIDPSSVSSIIPLGATPATLVFSPQGTFVKGWNGAFLGDTKEQIASYFGVKLP